MRCLITGLVAVSILGCAESEAPVLSPGAPTRTWAEAFMEADAVERVGLAIDLAGSGLAGTPELVAALADEEASVRAGAALTLGWMPGAPGTVVAPLVAALGDPSGAVREAAALTLGRRRARTGPAVEALLRATRDHEPAVAAAALWGLTQLGASVREAAPALREALRRPEPWVRARAVLALRGMRAPAAAPFLASLLADREAVVRWAALQALQHLGPIAVPELLDKLSYPKQQELAVRALAALGPAAVPALLEILKSAEASSRMAASRALLDMGAPAAPALAGALEDPDRHTRLTAARLLAEMGSEARPALEALLRGATGGETPLRELCLQALRVLGAAPQRP
ncbi:MAG: HEAT repeat domain-containing protein [Planctomycetota bacterium]